MAGPVSYSAGELKDLVRTASVRASILYSFALFTTVLLTLLGPAGYLACLPMLIIVFHGTHEAAHDSLVPGRRSSQVRRIAAEALGILGCALVGHNFALVRRSHDIHHRFGRLIPSATIDGQAAERGVRGRIEFYAGLLGWNCMVHEVAGYVYLLPARRRDGLHPSNYSPFERKSFVVGQIAVVAVTAWTISTVGWSFVVVRIAFATYWGMMQNVAHWGLEIGEGPWPTLAARTYRVPRLVEFLLFSSGFYHVEHHAFPGIPGACLRHPVFGHTLKDKFGITIVARQGLCAYVGDVLRQLRGPLAARNKTEWRGSDEKCSGGPGQPS